MKLMMMAGARRSIGQLNKRIRSYSTFITATGYRERKYRVYFLFEMISIDGTFLYS